tara:strand:+ start:1395 stop:1802 length:408 start_codon:yes stop_codon:yes gene_type:complete
MWVVEIIGVAAMLQLLYLHAKIDADLLNQKGCYIYNHSQRFLLRLISVLTISLLLWYMSGDNDPLKLLIRFAAYSILFGGMFDMCLNYFRGLDEHHLGTTAKWDIFWTKHIGAYKILTKYSLMISILLLFLLHIM